MKKIKEKIIKYLKTDERKHNFPKPMAFSKSSSKMEVYSDTSLL